MAKLRYDCERSGCFNLKRRPKIEVFDECFPGNISFGDVDGIVEINGNFLLLEWKCNKGSLPDGQRIMHEKLTASGRRTTVILVVGDAETMEIKRIAVCSNGRYGDFEPCSLSDLRARIRRWADIAYARKGRAMGADG